jgi:hypothetical protein
MRKYTAALAAMLLWSGSAFAGGELQAGPEAPAKRYVPAPAEQPAPAAQAAPAPRPVAKGRSIEGSGIHKYGFDVQRSLPMPAPYRAMGTGKEFNEFYGPTYYDPWTHNNWERLNPTYYPFFHPREWPNYKAPGDYCAGKLCGPSRSSHYWDSYDDWVRGGRYEQHQ